MYSQNSEKRNNIEFPKNILKEKVPKVVQRLMNTLGAENAMTYNRLL